MIEKAETLVALDVSFAAQHELEQVVWKPCFYKRIEEFRKRIRKVGNTLTTPHVVAANSELCSMPMLPRRIHKSSHIFEEFAGNFNNFWIKRRHFMNV